MKKVNFLVIVLMILGTGRLLAQCSTCTPVFQTCPPNGGLCGHLDTAYAHHPYDKIINFFMPKLLTDPSILALCGGCSSVELRHITVTGVSGLPTGVTDVISNNSYFNVSNNDTIGCAHFCGTPLLAGIYPVTVYLKADVTAHGTPIGNVDQNNVDQHYNDTLYVLPDTVAGVSTFTYGNNGSSACDSISIDLNALLTADQPNLTGYFWNIGNQTSQAKNPGVYSFMNTGTEPDTIPVTLTTVFYNYRVKKVHIAHISGGYCGDVEEATCTCLTGADSPDPYVKFPGLGFDNRNGYASNTCNNITFNNLNLVVPIGTQYVTVETWDRDYGSLSVIPPGSPDDLLGSDSIHVVFGQFNFSDNNTDGYVEFDTVSGPSFTETLNVIVNPSPITPVVVAASDTFCGNDSTLLSINTPENYANCTFMWYRDSVLQTQVADTATSFYANHTGEYHVEVTNSLTGCTNKSLNKAIVAATAAPGTGSIVYTGTQEFVTPFPSSGFAVDWYFNGALVPNQHGKFLPFLGDGIYTAEVYNIAYPACRRVSTPDTITSVGVNEVTYNPVNSVNIYPNPNTGKFTLQFASEDPHDITFYIRNTIGQIVDTHVLSHFSGQYTNEIDLSGFARGVYVVEIEAEGARIVKKVVVQ